MRFTMAKMYQLTHNGQPVGKAHPHRITCYIEALERGAAVPLSGRCRVACGAPGYGRDAGDSTRRTAGAGASGAAGAGASRDD